MTCSAPPSQFPAPDRPADRAPDPMIAGQKRVVCDRNWSRSPEGLGAPPPAQSASARPGPAADGVVPSRWPVDAGSVVYADHAHYALFLVDAQDDPVLAAPGAAEAFQLIMQRLGDSPGILAQRPVDELENRPGRVERDSPGRSRLESSQHSRREPDRVCIAHAPASSWRWRSSSAARSSSSV